MKKGFGNKINNKGFTLVEVLIAITILLIVSSALLALFANSYRDIEISGIKNKELYKIQDKLEESISLDNASEKKDLIISFQGIEQHIKIPGRIHSEKTEIQGKQIAISVFVPEQ